MKKYQIPDFVAISETGFIFHPSTGETFTVNLIGRYIIDLIKKGLSDTEIVTELSNEYDVDINSAEQDVADFIMQLKSYSLVKII